jgi:23S rRNA pseudouridine2605 synthase
MFEAVGHAVSRLIRIRYGAVVLPRGLRRGAWVELDSRDVARLTEAAGMDRSFESRAREFRRPQAKRDPSRGKGKGPRPSAPKLVEGPAKPRRMAQVDGARPGRGRAGGGKGAGAPDPMRTRYGYIAADARTPSRAAPGRGGKRPRR